MKWIDGIFSVKLMVQMPAEKIIVQKLVKNGSCALYYGHSRIRTYEKFDSLHKIMIENGESKIRLQMPMSGYAYIGTCQKCGFNWCELHEICPTHNERKLLCHCNQPQNDITFDINICQMCKYLSHVIIKFNQTIMESLHLCMCHTNTPPLKHSFKEDAYRFLTGIRLN